MFSCICVLLFVIEIIKISYHILSPFSIIMDAIWEFTCKSFYFSISMILPFVLLSTVYTYFLYGDFNNTYKKYSFHFIKAITSMYRGSIDNIDFHENETNFNSE